MRRRIGSTAPARTNDEALSLARTRRRGGGAPESLRAAAAPDDSLEPFRGRADRGRDRGDDARRAAGAQPAARRAAPRRSRRDPPRGEAGLLSAGEPRRADLRE